jgi:putative hydrolase of the HAD superfamily
VDFFISSCFVHFRKPDADIYRIALDIAQVQPAQVIYIEDGAMFVEVAKGLAFGGSTMLIMNPPATPWQRWDSY